MANRCAVPDGGIDATTDGTIKDASPDVPDVTVIDTSITGLTLTAPPPTLLVTIGTPDSSLTFTTTAQLASGGTVPIPNPTYSVSNVSPGVIDGNGHYVANGTIGGTVTVTTTVIAPNGTFTADATFNVQLVSTTGAGDGSPGTPGVVFMGTPVTDGAADAEILYPLNEAVMPQNVQPADIQWACDANGATCANADIFRVTITKPHITVTHYVRNDGSNTDGSQNDHFLPPGPVWRAIAQTDPVSDAIIRVDRYQAAQTRVVTGVNVRMRFVPAAITGTVYYWNIDRRRIHAIEDGTSTSMDLLPYIDSPVAGSPNYDASVIGNDDACVGCHSVSPSGRYMLANTHSANYGALYDLTSATLSTTNPTHSEFPGNLNIRWRLSSWSPDEHYAMVSTTDTPDRMRLINPYDGGTVPALDSLGSPLTLPMNGTMPAWARNDSAIAFVSNANSWAGNTTTGDLWRLPVVNSALQRFGSAEALLLASAFSGPEVVGYAGNRGIFYPTWTPDSQRIAFARGTSSRSDPRGTNGDWTAADHAHTSSIYIMSKDGGTPIRLARGCALTEPELKPGASDPDNMRTGLDFQPNFAPFQGGGYFWLSFLSRRPYGNGISGNRDMAIHPGQIWVMAVRMNANGNLDPSEVAYRLPGQFARERAVSAYWAPRACRSNGASCDVGSVCCSGDCRPPVGSNDAVCSPPDPEMCRQIGDTCNSVSDCCGAAVDPSIVCAGNVCEQIVIID